MIYELCPTSALNICGLHQWFNDEARHKGQGSYDPLFSMDSFRFSPACEKDEIRKSTGRWRQGKNMGKKLVVEDGQGAEASRWLPVLMTEGCRRLWPKSTQATKAGIWQIVSKDCSRMLATTSRATSRNPVTLALWLWAVIRGSIEESVLFHLPRCSLSSPPCTPGGQSRTKALNLQLSVVAAS